MLRRIDVERLDLPEIEPYLTLRRSLAHERQGIFVAEGGSVVERLLASPLEVVSVLVSPSWLEALRSPLEARPERIDAYVAEQSVLSTIVGFPLHQGVMAVARIPAERPLAETLARAPAPRLVVALDRVANAENLGVIARSSAAFAVDALLVGEGSSSPWLRRAVRVSMGTVFALRVHTAGRLVDTLLALAGQGFLTVAATPDGDPVDAADLTGDCCLVLGHEGRGVRSEVRQACRRSLAVPMPGGVDSLNVATATAVLLYEVRRQQRRAGRACYDGCEQRFTARSSE